MTERQMQKFKSVYGICLSVLTVVVGVLFIVQVWSIFFSAEQSPFTYAIIGEKFLAILAPVCLWILAIVGGGVIWQLYPDEKEALKGYVSPHRTLSRLKGRLPENEGGRYALKGEKSLRITVWSLAAISCVSALVATFATLLDGNYTPWSDLEFFLGSNAAADRLVRVAIYATAAILTCLVAVFIDEYVVKRQTEFVKLQIADNAKKGIKPRKAENKPSLLERILNRYPVFRSKWWRIGVQCGLCLIGVTLFVVGIVNGGMADVLKKACQICTQCIGLG